MLYPKEQKATKTLFFACRNCDHQEPADVHCVYRNQIIHPPTYVVLILKLTCIFQVTVIFREQSVTLTDLASDPTLPRTNRALCPRCGHSEAVFFQSKDTRSKDAAMNLFFVCCNAACNHRWMDTSSSAAF